jgi:hypothetical protein
MELKRSEERECITNIWSKKTTDGGRWEAIEEAIKNWIEEAIIAGELRGRE